MIRVVTNNDNVTYVNEHSFASFFFNKHERKFVAYDVYGDTMIELHDVVEVECIFGNFIKSDIYNVQSFVDVD